MCSTSSCREVPIRSETFRTRSVNPRKAKYVPECSECSEFHGLQYNYTECFNEILPPSIDTVKLGDEETSAYYYPFGELSRRISLSPEVRAVATSGNTGTGACSENPMLTSGAFLYESGVSYGYSDEWGCMDVTGGMNLAEAITAWQEVVATPEVLEEICETFKTNQNGFRCFDKGEPPTTKEQAIERYTSEYPPETICAPLKLNSPFQCTRDVEVPMATILSLSVASAQGAFAVGGLVFVSLLRKLEKPGKDTTTSGDDDLRVLVRKLRAGQSRHEELIQNLIHKRGDHQA